MYFCICIIMPDTKYIAMVLGSSGLIGMETINLLLKNNKYQTVYAISRTALPIENDKLIQILADAESIKDKIKNLHIDHFFSCIGTTASKTPDKEKYYAIDLNYPMQVAQILHNNGCESMCLVSSIGANASSKNFYLKLKGDVEIAAQQVGFKSLHIFRPSFLLGNRKEFRLLERVIQFFYPIINLFLVGKLKDYRSIEAKDIASAMINVSISAQTGTYMYQTQLIKELA